MRIILSVVMENVDLKLFSIRGNKIKPYEKHTRIARDCKKSHENFVRDEVL